MAKVSLILADRDEFFAERFSRYILDHNNFFDIVSFTEAEYLLNYLSTGKADVVLLEKDFATNEIIEKLKNKLVLIFDDCSKEVGDISYINKYQKTEALIKEITFKYAESIGNTGIISDNTGVANIIAVYSPIGGSGKTTVAMALAAGLVQQGCKTTYLNLEKFNSIGTYVNLPLMEGLSEIFLKIKNKGPNLSFDIMKNLALDESGVNYFVPAESAMEFNEMTNEEIMELVSKTSDIADVEYLVIDLPSEFNENILNILKMSNSVVFISTNDAVGINKTKMFMNEMNIFADLKFMYEKFLPVINKTNVGGIPPEFSEIFVEKQIYGCIPLLNNLRATTISEISNCMDNYLVNVMRAIMGR